MESELIMRDEFRDWLLRLPPTQLVGTPNDSFSCPIATALCDLYQASSAYVSYRDMNVYAGGSPRLNEPTPQWAREFMDRIDRLIRLPIDAATALRVLDSEEEEEE